MSSLLTILTPNGALRVESVREPPISVAEEAHLPVAPTGSGHFSAQSPGRGFSAAVTSVRLLSSLERGDDASYATLLADPADYYSDSGESEVVPSFNERLSAAGLRTLHQTYARLLESAVLMAERMVRRDYSAADVAWA